MKLGHDNDQAFAWFQAIYTFYIQRYSKVHISCFLFNMHFHAWETSIRFKHPRFADLFIRYNIIITRVTFLKSHLFTLIYIGIRGPYYPDRGIIWTWPLALNCILSLFAKIICINFNYDHDDGVTNKYYKPWKFKSNWSFINWYLLLCYA